MRHTAVWQSITLPEFSNEHRPSPVRGHHDCRGAGMRPRAGSSRENHACGPAIVETHAEEANAIHLTEDMVRDLRISTATVVPRSGAGEVTALGEVVADQAR